ncbi:hypothetical protein Tco_0736325 [Tanacetum coccineum]
MKAIKEKEQLQKTLDSWKDSSKNLWRLIASGMSSNKDSIGKPLYSRFTKTNDFKGVPHPLSGDYTPKPQEEIDDSLKCKGRELRGLFHTGNWMEKPVWTKANRVNHSNKFVPRSVQLNAGRPNFNSVRPNINTGRTNINSVRPKVNAVSSNINTVRSRHQYALTSNPPIYDSLVKQFWQTATTNTIADGTLEIHATIDTKRSLNFTQTYFDGMVANLKSKKDEVLDVIAHFLATDLDIQTENNTLFGLRPAKKIFGNMKRGFRGAPRPLLPAMLLVATTNPNAGQEHHAVTQTQPSSSTLPVPSTSSPPVQSPPPIPASIPTPTPIPESEPAPFEHTFEEPSPPGNGSQTNQADNGECSCEVSQESEEVGRVFEKEKCGFATLIEENLRLKGRTNPDDPLGFLCTRTVYSFYDKVNTADGVNTASINLEEASLAEAIRLDTLQKEEVAKQVHLDSLLAQRIAEEEEELNEQQKKRKAQVQFEAQHYTDEDWDLIRAKIEANAELSKVCLEEERARAKRNKPMTQSQLKTYMMNYLKNQGTWKLSQLKNLSFEEVKEEFDKAW